MEVNRTPQFFIKVPTATKRLIYLRERMQYNGKQIMKREQNKLKSENVGVQKFKV